MQNLICNFKIMIAIALTFLFSTNVFAFNLVGTWKLISIHQTKFDGIKCHSPTGLLMYHARGYMSVGVNCMKSENQLKPDFNPNNLTFYSGKYLIKGDKVIHLVENASDLAYYGKRLERKLIILNDQTILLLVKGKNGNLIQLKWQRMGN